MIVGKRGVVAPDGVRGEPEFCGNPVPIDVNVSASPRARVFCRLRLVHSPIKLGNANAALPEDPGPSPLGVDFKAKLY